MMGSRRSSKHSSRDSSSRASGSGSGSGSGSTPAHVVPTPPSTTGSSKSSRVTDSQFETRLAEAHIYPPKYQHAGGRTCPLPSNFDDIQERLHRRRPSLSHSKFGQSQFDTFCKKDARVISESSVMSEVVPLIHGSKDFETAQNLQFTNITPFTQGLPKPQPDLYDGALSSEIAKPVRDKLEHTVVPTKYAKAPIAPNFFLEAKGPLRAPLELRCQITNDLGAGVQAMDALHNYGRSQPVYDGKAYAMGSTYHAGSGSLHIYTGHITKSPEGNLETHITQTRGFCLTDSSETLRNGVGAFRNARDLAKEYRDELLQEANRQPVEVSSDDEVDGRESRGKSKEKGKGKEPTSALASNRKRSRSSRSPDVRKRQGK